MLRHDKLNEPGTVLGLRQNGDLLTNAGRRQCLCM